MTLTEMEPLKIHLDSLEMAGKMVDKHIIADSNFPSLINLMRYNVQGKLYIAINTKKSDNNQKYYVLKKIYRKYSYHFKDV